MLNQKKCVPCKGGVDPLNQSEIDVLMKKLQNNWKVHDNKKLQKEYVFQLYSQAINFTNHVSKLAEEEGHHPYIHINYKTVILIIFTHKINGLHENDFILASKCDLLL